MRLTEEEKKRFEAAAAANGLSLSDWVRLNLRASSAPDRMHIDPRANITGRNE